MNYRINCFYQQLLVTGSRKSSVLSLVSSGNSSLIWTPRRYRLYVETAVSLHSQDQLLHHMRLSVHKFSKVCCWVGVSRAHMCYISLPDIMGTGLRWYWVVLLLRTTFIPVCRLPPTGSVHQAPIRHHWMRSKWPVNGFGPCTASTLRWDAHKSSENYPEEDGQTATSYSAPTSAPFASFFTHHVSVWQMYNNRVPLSTENCYKYWVSQVIHHCSNWSP